MITSEHSPGIAILASGGGSTAEAFIHATQDGRVAANVGLVVCSQPPEKAGIYERIGRLNEQYKLDIETLYINGCTHPEGNVGRGQTDAESLAICEAVARRHLTHVALMGYMRMVRGDLLQEFGQLPTHDSIYQARMTNTHPGPLPETADTYGIGTSQRVLNLGLTASRHTFHLVGAVVDGGSILAEHPVEIHQGDTAQSLFDRVQVVEKAALPYALDQFLRNQKEYYAN